MPSRTVKGGLAGKKATEDNKTESVIGTKTRVKQTQTYEQFGKRRVLGDIIETEIDYLEATSKGVHWVWVMGEDGKKHRVQARYYERVTTDLESGRISKHQWNQIVNSKGDVLSSNQVYTSGTVADMIDAGADTLGMYLESAGVSSEYADWFRRTYASMTGEQKGKFWSTYHKDYADKTYPSTASDKDGSTYSLIDDSRAGGIVEAINKSLESVYGDELNVDSIPFA